MTDTRTYRGADIGSDHNLVLATIKLKNQAMEVVRSCFKNATTQKSEDCTDVGT